MKKIVWFSRHEPIPSQLKELERVFGEVEVVVDPNPFSTAEEVVERFREAGADEMLVVAPLSVIAKICEQGIKPLWAEMEVVPEEKAEVHAGGRFYRFKRFRRIKRVVMEFEDFV